MHPPMTMPQPFLDDQAIKSERTYSLFNHLVGLLSLADATFMGLIAAIVMWRIRRDDSPFLDDHGREAVNFQISLLIYFVAAFMFGIITVGLGWIFFIPIYILRLVGCIRGAIAANRGEFYRYPMCIRFLHEPV